MKKTVGPALAILLLTAACGSAEDDVQVAVEETEETDVKPRPLAKSDPEAYKMSPGTAMREIPPALRTQVQRSIICYTDHKRETEGTVAIDADTIRAITNHIKSGGSSNDYCKS